MEQNPNQNQNEGFFQKNRNYIIAVIIVIVAIIMILSQRQSDETGDTRDEQATEQDSGENGEAMDGEGTEGAESGTKTGDSDSMARDSLDAAGNVSAVGTLKASDNASLGNLMLDSDRGVIYIKTARDFNSLLGKQVTLAADGTLDSFVFLEFKEGGETKLADRMEDKRGDGEAMEGKPEEGSVKVSGKLMLSDNEVSGNYMIESDQDTIYLKSVRDYSAWVNSDVELSATGTINSFSRAVLSKK